MKLTYRPLPVWTAPNTARRRSDPYRSRWDITMKDLGRELTLLKARRPVLQLMVAETDIRADGSGLLAGRRPAHPGVVLAFDTETSAMSFPCDSCTEWRDNVRSIALGLTALRAVDRYGISPGGEQYQGWKQLPPGRATDTGPVLTPREAAAFMAEHGNDGTVPMDPAALTDMLLNGVPAILLDVTYRRAVRSLHPDMGGDQHLFLRLQEAKATLDAHHGTG